jgi:ATP-binding cassette subfamily F protein 3
VDSPFRFSFRAAAARPDPLLALERVRAGYRTDDGERVVLDGIDLSLRPDDRIALLGPNGAGKSTLIKLLAGGLSPLDGLRDEGQGLAIGYFAQHQVDQLDPDASPLRHLERLEASDRSAGKPATEQQLRDFLGGFGFHGDRATEAVAPFSGGEKARLALALIVWQRPNLLLLDEPTNHLDLDMRLALSEALLAFDGALVLVSHDRHLLRVTCDTLLLVDAGAARPFDGSLEDYPAWLAARAKAMQAGGAPDAGADSLSSPAPLNGGDNAGSRKEQRRREAEQRARLQPLKRRVDRLEAELERLTAERETLETSLAEPALYSDDAKPRLLALLADKQRVDTELERVEADWLEAAAELEALRG